MDTQKLVAINYGRTAEKHFTYTFVMAHLALFFNTS